MVRVGVVVFLIEQTPEDVESIEEAELSYHTLYQKDFGYGGLTLVWWFDEDDGGGGDDGDGDFVTPSSWSSDALHTQSPTLPSLCSMSPKTYTMSTYKDILESWDHRERKRKIVDFYHFCWECEKRLNGSRKSYIYIYIYICMYMCLGMHICTHAGGVMHCRPSNIRWGMETPGQKETANMIPLVGSKPNLICLYEIVLAAVFLKLLFNLKN